MELIIGDNKQIIDMCYDFAKNFLMLPHDKPDFLFEDCPSKMFPTMANAAESTLNETKIYFNKQWFEQRVRDKRIYDIEFFVFHELRHYHQYGTVLTRRQDATESLNQINRWEEELFHYKKNYGDTQSQQENVSQSIEIDANGYALALVNLYHIDDDMELCISLPEDVGTQAFSLCQRYLDSCPELKKYIQLYQEKMEEKKKLLKRIGRNDLCPCGSGTKFKKCNCQRYHFPDSTIRVHWTEVVE